MGKLFQDSLSTATTTSKLETEARKPSGWEWFPIMWAGCIALGLLIGAWIGLRTNASDILPHLITGFFVGASAPVVAVVILATAMTAYGLRMRALWFVERLAKTDVDGDGVQGDPQHYLTIRGGYAAPAEPSQNMTMAEFVRLCSEHSTAWQSYWRPMARISQSEWETKRNVLIGAHLADWNNPEFPNSGWHLTASADTIIRQLGK
jgi:hypothetical protein